jgi:hypothetical protein
MESIQSAIRAGSNFRDRLARGGRDKLRAGGRVEHAAHHDDAVHPHIGLRWGLDRLAASLCGVEEAVNSRDLTSREIPLDALGFDSNIGQR